MFQADSNFEVWDVMRAIGGVNFDMDRKEADEAAVSKMMEDVEMV